MLKSDLVQTDKHSIEILLLRKSYKNSLLASEKLAIL